MGTVEKRLYVRQGVESASVEHRHDRDAMVDRVGLHIRKGRESVVAPDGESIERAVFRNGVVLDAVDRIDILAIEVEALLLYLHAVCLRTIAIHLSRDGSDVLRA